MSCKTYLEKNPHHDIFFKKNNNHHHQVNDECDQELIRAATTTKACKTNGWEGK